MVRFLVIVFGLLISTMAHGADGAQSRAIGFSPDGKYFAFEQYGNQDGSGFTYSDIFVLDLVNDKWVAGTPIRVLHESEEDPIDVARAKAWRLAEPIIAKFNVTASYDTLAHRPFTELVPDRRKVQFARYYNSLGSTEGYEAKGVHELSVQDVPVPSDKTCADYDSVPAVGMELTLRNVTSGKVATLVKDTSIPKSRFCPAKYDIESIYAMSAYSQTVDPHVAIIGVFSRGFEGLDRRFIAVPFELIE
jgi:predicted secreted protein